MAGSLPVINLSDAKFECTYGRGCEGLCCQNGRPGVNSEEIERLEDNLPKFLPHLRSEARQLIAERGYLSNRRKEGLPMLRVVEGWCVFFNQGCVFSICSLSVWRHVCNVPKSRISRPIGTLETCRHRSRNPEPTGACWSFSKRKAARP